MKKQLLILVVIGICLTSCKNPVEEAIINYSQNFGDTKVDL
jgi:hypothetical protein